MVTRPDIDDRRVGACESIVGFSMAIIGLPHQGCGVAECTGQVQPGQPPMP
jgi:hypothetical protein